MHDLGSLFSTSRSSGSAWGPAGPDGQFTMTFGYDGSATMGLAKRKYACKVWADTNWQGL